MQRDSVVVAMGVLVDHFGLLLTIVVVTVLFAAFLAWKTVIEPRLRTAAESAGRLGAELKLQEAKYRLDRDAEIARGNFQRHLTSYSVFAQRRHEAIAELLGKILSAQDHVFADHPVPYERRSQQWFDFEVGRTGSAVREIGLASRAHALYISPALYKSINDTIGTFSIYSYELSRHAPDTELTNAVVNASRAVRKLIETAQRDVIDPETLPSRNPELPAPGN
ncbi:MAG: hypothetical protein ACO1Q7_17600 [Gemmatimonas sp.]